VVLGEDGYGVAALADVPVTALKLTAILIIIKQMAKV